MKSNRPVFPSKKPGTGLPPEPSLPVTKNDIKGIFDSLANDCVKLRKERIVILSCGIDDCIASDFISEMMLLVADGKDPIKIIISSPGGEILPGLGIIRAIQYAQSKGIKVIGEVFGQALSMAFFILQTCDTRVMGEGDFIMCHGVFVLQGADRKGRKAEDKMLDTAETYFCKMIASKNNSKHNDFHDEDYWRQLLEEDTPNYYSADEAFDMGLIDKVENR